MVKIKELTRKNFEEACIKSQSMAQAAAKLGLHFTTFKKYALLYGVYRPNQSGKGIKKNIPFRKEVGSHLSRAGTRYRILKDNLIEYKCSICDIIEWQGQKLSLQLDHIDGNGSNNMLENLRWLCPNCHSLTPNFTGKNKNKAL